MELKEELGLDVNGKDLKELGEFYPSPGGCDEAITLYYYEATITQEVFDRKQRSVFGSASESEHIMLQFIPEKKMSSVLFEIGDAKAEIAYRRYLVEKRRNRGADCGYGAKTARGGFKYKGINPEYCEYSDDTARCRVIPSKKRSYGPA